MTNEFPRPIAAADIQVGDKIMRRQVKHFLGSGMEETVTSEVVFTVEEVQNSFGNAFTFIPAGDDNKTNSLGTGIDIKWFLIDRPVPKPVNGDIFTHENDESNAEYIYFNGYVIRDPGGKVFPDRVPGDTTPHRWAYEWDFVSQYMTKKEK